MRRLSAALVLILFLAAASGCGAPPKPVTRSDYLLDTFIVITLYDGGTEALDGAFELCGEYDAMLDRHREGSEIWNLNHAEGSALSVSPQVAELVETALAYCEITGGRYDITIAPVMDLWDFKAEEPTRPDPDELKAALTLVNWQNVEVSEGSIRLREGAQIDLGSIAKGYIADRIGDYLRAQGVKSAIVDLGGNVLTIGGKPDGSPFNIGVQKPFSPQELAGTLQAADTSLVSSGLYERGFTLEGKRYHHIIDAATGYPAESAFDSVTILSDRSVDGDALSTVCFLLGYEASLELLEGMEGVEAIFLYPDGSIRYTPDFEAHYTFSQSEK